MPPVVYGAHLIEWLWSFGPVTSDGAPVSWQEINAWQQGTNRALSTWEAETLRKMSEGYAVMQIKAKEEACKAPWNPVKLNSKALNDKIMAFFGPMIKPSGTDTGKKPTAQKIPRQKPDGRRSRRD